MHFELSEMIHNVVYIQVVVYIINLEIRLWFRFLTRFVTFQLQSFKVLGLVMMFQNVLFLYKIWDHDSLEKGFDTTSNAGLS